MGDGASWQRNDLTEGRALSEFQREDWPELPDGEQGLPEFPTNALPDELRALVRGLAKAQQVSEAMVAAFALGVASAALVGRAVVQPKKSHLEAIQLYILCMGKSGERKSGVLRVLKGPLEKWLEEARETVRRENRDSEIRIAALGKSISKEKSPDNVAALMAELERLKDALIPEPEYLMSEMTMESIAVSMDKHKGRAVIVYDEADFLMALAGKNYAKEGAAVNLTAALQGYGNEAYHGQRVGRGEWHIPCCSLALCLGAQPGILNSFIEDAAGADRGLHGRFLYFLPESKIGTRTSADAEMPAAALEWWQKTIWRLAGLARENGPLLLPFDCYAECAYRAFFDRIERRLLLDLGENLQPWGGKLVGNTVRLAGLLALLDGAEVVGRGHWDAAETIAENYLIPCAVRLFRGADPALGADEKKLLGIIRDSETFCESDLWRDKARYTFQKDKTAYSRALLDLCGHHYIRPAKEQTERKETGRKPSPIWEVHPALHRKKAPEGQIFEL